MSNRFPDKVQITDGMIDRHGLSRMVRLAMKTRAAGIVLEIPWHFCYLFLAKMQGQEVHEKK